MILLRLSLFFMTLWHFSRASNNALFFNWKEQSIVEISKFDDKAVCRSCISVCPTTSNSIEEKLLNDRVSVTGNSNFFRQMYPVVAPAGKMQIDVCEKKFSPGLVWDTKAQSFDVGYEMYYEEGQVDLKYMYYDHYIKVIDGKPSLKPKDTPSQDEIKIYREDEKVEFEIADQPGKKFNFYFIDVLSFDISKDEKQRTVTFIADTINDYRHQVWTISNCKTYLSGDNTTEIGEKEEANVPVNVKNTSSDNKVLAEELKTNSEQPGNPPNRLIKTQILPMRMFHTLAGRLSTCMYLNIAFVWESIAEGQLRKINVFLYALYRLFPSGLKLVFGVSGDLQGIDPIASKEIASEHHLFTKFPVPKVISRFVDYGVAGKLYGAVVVIHNNLESVQDDDDRICPANEEVEGWDDIRNRNAANGYSYVCKQTPQVFKNLGLDENAAPVDMIPLKLNSFPYTRVKNAPIEYKSALNRIDIMLNYIKELNIEY